VIRVFSFLVVFFAFICAVCAEVSPGELLLSEMNCVACHEASPEIKARLASRPSPKLGTDGVRLTPQWLQAFLKDPQATQPGTLMPDLLGTFAAEQKAEAVEALTHFLVGLQGPAVGAGRGVSTAAIDVGRRLFHTIGCVQCHAPVELPAGKENDVAAKEELAKLTSVPLGDLARKFTVGELAAFLRDPLKARPGGRMPALKLESSEAEAIAMWLLRAQMPSGTAQQIAGLRYAYYEKQLPELPEFDRLKPDAEGIAETFTLAVAKRHNDYALRFTGTITVPQTGEYKFYTESDDGSRLAIDGKQVVENNGVHPSQVRDGVVTLTAGAHAIMVAYFDGGGQTELHVRWRGPGFGKQDIPANVLSHDGQPMVPVGDAPFTVDPAKAARGKELFTQLNCAACHAGTDIAGVKSKPLPQLIARRPAGCLASAAKPGVPHFEITDRQRQVVLAALGNQPELATPLEPEQQIRRTLTVFNCYACHHRDRRGGPEGLRREYFATSVEVDLGDEGRIPPHLNAVGAKLRPDWIREVLAKGGAVRPYMATRMPQFGEANVAPLAALFEKTDTLADAQPDPDVKNASGAEQAKFGRKLVGIGGVSCVACHVFAGHKSLGVPALDLTTVAKRVKWDWFRRYLIDPQSLRPGTRMPSFFPNGVAANRDILGGDAPKQIGALWAYLARGEFGDLPDGLVQGKAEIIATTEAVIYRNFIEGAGSRAIGVGYPEKANLAFDANDMRLAMLWQGAFIDAAKHRDGRGAGFEKPLGVNVLNGPPGAPFAILESESTAWPAGAGKSAGYQFKGYHLDDQQRPTFTYTFGGMKIDDYPVAVPGELDPAFKRTLTFISGKPIAHLYFRAAIADKIAEQPGGSFLVSDKARYRFTGAKAFIRSSGGKSELLVPIPFDGNAAKLVEEIAW
jgi:cytochrome c2